MTAKHGSREFDFETLFANDITSLEKCWFRNKLLESVPPGGTIFLRIDQRNDRNYFYVFSTVNSKNV